jgi:nitroreductase
METLEAIMTRRSVRKFTDEPVDEKTIEKILRAGMQAPSAHNEQPWHFVVVTDRALMKKIPGVSPYAGMAAEAALAIIVCFEAGSDHVVEDCSGATENLLLAAHALGLGAVWTAVYPNEKRVSDVRQLFNLPESVTPLCIVPIGHPAEKKAPEDRFLPERVHRNGW